MTSHSEISRQLVRRVNQLYHRLTQERFDTDHYWRHRAERLFWQQVGQQVLSCPHRSKWTLVDLACGTGFVTQNLAPYLTPDDRIIAIDVDEAPLRSTATKWQKVTRLVAQPPRLWRMACDGHQLPLASGSVNLLAINAALHHLPDSSAVLAEIDRVLKPGGWFALGFEPNRTHFRSPLAGCVRVLDRMSWYGNWEQNRRRLGQLAARCRRSLTIPTTMPAMNAGPLSDMAAAEIISQQLHAEGAIGEHLSPTSVMDLVDPHARGGGEEQGFDFRQLLQQHLDKYQVHSLTCTDYLGESVRRFPTVRRMADCLLSIAAPRHGSLFSWLIRKPMDSSTCPEEPPCVA